MIAPSILVSLYPPAVREYWGSGLAQEVAAGGPRSWLDTVTGAARLWAHPSDWPERTAGQTRRVLLVELAAAVTLVALLLRASGRPSATFAASIGHPAASTWLLAVLLGLGFAAPVPRLRWRALRELGATCLRTLAAPTALLLALFALAQTLPVHHPLSALPEISLRLFYWTTLVFAGLRVCALAGRIGHVAATPSTRRLLVAALCIGTGLALAAAQNLVSELNRGPAFGATALSAGLAAIAVLALVTAHDLGKPGPGNQARSS
jgi:hypothetical protein